MWLWCFFFLIFGQYATGSQPRILGGRDALPAEFTFEVCIFNEHKGRPLCGGSIISQNHVLTARHCLRNKSRSDVKIIAGVKNVYRYENPQAVQERKILEYYIRSDQYLDLAIVKVNVPFQFTATVQPISLPPANFRPPANLPSIVGGWGWTDFRFQLPAARLKVLPVKIIDFGICIRRVPRLKIYHVCAGGMPGVLNQGICHGDSGGPLIYYGPQPIQIGVLSVATDFCGYNKTSIGAYVSVSFFRNWIDYVLSIP